MVRAWSCSLVLLVVVAAVVMVAAAHEPAAMPLFVGGPLNNTYYSVFQDDTAKYRMVEGQQSNAIAWGKLSDEMTVRGAARLWLESNAAETSRRQAEAAGYLEGALSAQMTRDFLANYEAWLAFKLIKTTPLYTFFVQWISYLRDSIATSASTDAYWRHVELVLFQIDGIVLGHNDNSDDYHQLEAAFVVVVNAQTELDDIMQAINMTAYCNLPDHRADCAAIHAFSTALRSDHCSALVKMLPGNTDILFSHVTWGDYKTMNRIWKSYKLPFAKGFDTPASTHVAFSSYPIALWSIDDFYITSARLAIMETTNNVYNDTLFQRVKPVGQVLTWMRAVLATRLASSSPAWVKTFQRYHTGTYANQWIVLDYKLWRAGSPLPLNALWIAEELPGVWQSADVSAYVNAHGYWPSYNVPYFSDIWHTAGYEAQWIAHNKTDEYTWARCARARIFARNQTQVTDVTSFRHVMRYNNYQHDPLSQGRASLAISSRYDLLPTGGGAVGGIDCKMTSSASIASMQWDAISGPTNEQVPTFVWSTSRFADTLHHGQPDRWGFDWLNNVNDPNF